jgi:hypothetical protein
MNTAEAKSLLDRYISDYVRRPYEQLEQMIDHPVAVSVEGPSGTRYNLEVEVFWDDTPGGSLRLAGSIDNAGIRAFVPLTRSRRPVGGSRMNSNSRRSA